MNKIAIDIPGQDGKWGSYISKYPSDSGRIPQNAFTIDTRNVVTALSGQAEKIMGGSIWNPNSLLSTSPLDQYEAVFSSGTRLLIFNVAGTLVGSSGNNLFSTIQGGFNSKANFEFASYQDRVYGDNGVDGPIVIDTATAYGGVTYSFTLAKTKAMGAQAPSSAPTVTLVVDSTTPQVPAGAHTYKITFVYYNGQEESNGGPASSPVTNDATHTSNSLTAIPVGGYGVSARNIYRDNNDGNWLLLDTINNNTATTYTDRLVIGSTPTPIPTTNGLPPTFKYIANWLDRNFVAGVEGAPNSLFWSIAGEPDVFDPANRILCRNDDVITALFVFNGLLYVFGQHSVGVILGNTDTTFYYSPISTTVGCVDNRSIAVRSLISVPTMIWLSALPNRGFYYSNGSAVQFLSEFIDDLALNISQIAFLERSNTQATQTAFEGDTSSPGIDLTTNPGAIQTINPRAFYGAAVDWLTGVFSNLCLVGDQLENMIAFQPTPGSGNIGGDLQISGSNFALPTIPTFSGEDHTGEAGGSNVQPSALTCFYAAQQITPPVSGTVTSFSMRFNGVGGATPSPTQWFYAPDSLGTPGTVVPIGGGFFPSAALQTLTTPASIPVTAGVPIWIIIGSASSFRVTNPSPITSTTNFFPGNAYFSAPGTPGSWTTLPNASGTIKNLLAGYTVVQTPIADAGNWTSPVYDTLCDTNTGTGMSIDLTGSYPAGCTSTVVVQGAAAAIGPWTTTDSLPSPTTGGALTGGAYRFWRVIDTINTTDNRNTPTLSVPEIQFNQTGTWTSPVITTTADITALVSLVAGISSPAGTSFTLYIRTSPTGVGSWTAYGPVGSATPDKFAQLQLTMNTDSTDTLTAVTSTVELDWSIGSMIQSTPIDTGANPPAGWGPFQYDQAGGGTVQFYFRTAASSGALSSATYIAVANTATPTNTVLEWVQWKGVFTATANNFPQINSVTVNWFIGSGTAARCASVFFNKSYFCAVATKGSAFNNLLIEFDQDGSWRIHSAFNIATLGTYFNDLYYGSSISGDVFNAFKQTTEGGTNIVFDMRTKCFDYGDMLHLKTVRSLKVTGVGTGTLLHAYYSLDRGATWIEMLNSSGVTGFQTTANGVEFTEYFIPTFDGSTQTGGRNVIYRLVSEDQYPCTILRLSPTVYMRKGKALREIIGF